MNDYGHVFGDEHLAFSDFETAQIDKALQHIITYGRKVKELMI